VKIKSAEFVISNSDVGKCPSTKIPEYAFIGRSNVGKSSLINALVSRKSLAKTSGRPGKTQLINHFIINKEWFLVVDCRHEPQKVDLEFMEWLAIHEVPFSIIFTKSDKLTPSKLPKNIEIYKNKMLEVWEEMPPYSITSSASKQGCEEVLAYIDKLNKNFRN